MVSLGQKLIIPKTFEKPFYKNIRVVLCKKTARKKHQIFEKWDDYENRPSCKGDSPCKGFKVWKMVCLDQKLKLPKTCEKPLLKKIRVVLCEKPLEKRPNIREMRQFWKSAILQWLEPMQREIFEKWDDFEYWEKLCPCKGYRLCKIISLGEKIKLPLPYEKRTYRQNGLTLFKKGL